MVRKFFSFSVLRTWFLCSMWMLGITHVALAEEWIVKFRENQFRRSIATLKNTPSVQMLTQHDQGRIALINIDSTSTKHAANVLQQIRQRSEVEYIVLNIKLHAFETETTTDDPQRSKQWALEKIQAEEAWHLQRGAKTTVVAVIDTGVDWKHEDLQNRIWNNPAEVVNGKDDDNNGFIDDVRGWDFRDKDSDPMDETSSKNPGHGTHCAGIIGATGENGVGISGIAPNISILPVRFLGADGSGDLYTAALAIDYATNQHAQVISASWGAAVPREQVKPILEAIQRAEQQGVIFVAAAANDGKSNDTREVYPANAGFKNVISVAASDPQDQKPAWSNYGVATVDIASPGLNIFSTLPNNQYGNLSGTSMATPLVAGMVGLLKSQANELSRNLRPEAYKAILQASSDEAAIETACKCRVNAFHALENVIEQQLTVVPNAATIEPQGTLQVSGIGGKAPYKFAVSKPEVASIDASTGVLTAKQEGQVVLSLTDATGETVQSKTISVSKRQTPSGGQCPLDNPILCQLLCAVDPTLPWCSEVDEENLF